MCEILRFLRAFASCAFCCCLQKPFLLFAFPPPFVVFLHAFLCVFLVSFTPSLFFSVFFFIQCASLQHWVSLWRGCYSRICCCFFALIKRFRGFFFKRILNPLLQLLQGCRRKGAEELQIVLASMENRRSIVAIRSQVVQQPAVSPTKEGTVKPTFLFLFLE